MERRVTLLGSALLLTVVALVAGWALWPEAAPVAGIQDSGAETPMQPGIGSAADPQPRARTASEQPDSGPSRASARVPGAEVTGRVLDARGVPLGGVAVQAVPDDSEVSGPAPEIAVRTDPQGWFRLALGGRDPRRTLILLRPAGHGVVGVRLDAGSELGDLQLAVAGSVVGRIESRGPRPDGLAVRLVPLSTTRDLPPPTEGVVRRTAVEADGSFRFEDVALGLHRAVPVAGGEELLAPRTAVRVQAVGPDDLGTIRLVDGRNLTGIVTDRAGQPIPEARVTLTPRGGFGLNARRQALTGADGRFRLEQVVDVDDAELRVRAKGYQQLVWSGVEWAAARGAPLHLRLDAGRVVRGLVVAADGSGPVTRFAAMADPVDAPSSRGGGTGRRRAPGFRGHGVPGGGTDTEHAGGRFELGGLDPGWYVVTILARGHVPWCSDPVDLRDGDGELHAVVTRGLRYAGSVVARPGGEPLEGAELHLAPLEESSGRFQARDRTGPDGRFAVTGLRPGRHRVQLIARDLGAVEVFEIEVSRSQDDVQLELLRPGWWSGRVQGLAAARGEHPVSVLAYGGGSRLEVGTADADGRFRLGPMRPGNYVVRAFDVPLAVFLETEQELLFDTAPEDVPAELVLAAGEEHVADVTLTTPPLATLAGRVVVDGEPSVGCVVELSKVQARSVCDAQGRYRLEGLPAGEWGFEVALPGDQRRKLWFTQQLTAGDDAMRDLYLATGTLRGRLAGADWPEGKVVAVWHPDARPDGLVWLPCPITIEGRSFEVEGVPAGPGRLVLRGPGSNPLECETEVPAGGATPVLEIRGDG